MGTAKAWLPFDKETLLQRVVRVVSRAARPIVLAARRGMDLPPLSIEFELVYDEPDVAGPLAGMAAAMNALRGRRDAALVVGCDHPFVSAPVLQRMIDLLGDHDAVVPELEGVLFPTLAVYRLSTLATLEELLSKGELRAREFARRCHPRPIGVVELADVDPNLLSFCNINTPEEYEAARIAARHTPSKGEICGP